MALALVTGASRGIGRAIALDLGRHGFDVIVAYRTQRDAAEEVARLIEALGRAAPVCELDVSLGERTEAAVTALVETHGCPDLLVNNAGARRDSLFAMMSRASFSSILETNLGSFYSVTRPVLRPMLRRRSGRIVSIASVSGLRGSAGQVNYSASKAGLIGATKALALEVAPRNITVNAVAPGFIATDMTAELPADKLLEVIPMGRLGRPEEVAALVTFLASEAAAYITGQVVSVNGGLYT